MISIMYCIFGSGTDLISVATNLVFDLVEAT